MFFPPDAPSVLEVLRTLWAECAGVFIFSLLASLLLTPVFRSLAIRFRVYDMPDQRLKPHARPIPYLGGLAIFLGIALPLLVVGLAHQDEPAAAATADASQAAGSAQLQPPASQAAQSERTMPTRALWAVLIGATLIVITGLVDDLVSIKPTHKIIAQVAAALVLVAGGVTFRGIPYGFEDVQWLTLDSPVLVWGGIALQICLVVGACNATNLLDGLDGLCSGVTAIIATGFLLLATSIASWHHFGGSYNYEFSLLIMLISFAMLGAALGFLPYNFNPASIFMGDAGSMLLGFLCATLMIMFSEKPGMLKWFIGALFIFGLPIFDTSLAYARRKLNGKPIFQGDRSHFYDQLVDRGMTVKQAVVSCYALALFFVVMGLAIIFMRTRYGVLVYLGVAALLVLIVVRAGMLRVDDSKVRKPASPMPADQAGKT